MLGNTPNQPSKFRTKNWVEINDDLHGTYSSGSPIRFKTSMLKSSLLNYSDAYILVSRIITITGGAEDTTLENKRTDERVKGVIFKNSSTFIECTSKIINTQIDYKYSFPPSLF